MRDNTKTVGDLAELKAACYFAEQGYFVSKPMGDNAPYDLIVDMDGKLKRIQVKARSERNNVVSVELQSCMRNYTHKYTEDDWDVLAVYNITSGQLAIICWDDIDGRDTLKLRTAPTKNGQKKGILMFEEFIP